MIPPPKLDDRTFHDIVEEAISMIPRYSPEWTNHNASDPGIETGTAFGTTGTDNGTTTFGSHTNKKAVGAFAANNRRLISALHDKSQGK